MGEQNTAERCDVDYLAPFETFHAYRLRRGAVYRGRIRPEYAADPRRLRRILGAVPGTYHVEKLDGRLYATLRVYHGRRPRQRLWLHGVLLVLTALTTLGAGAEMRHGRTLGALIPFEFTFDVLSGFAVGDGPEVMRARWPQFRRQMAAGAPYAAALLFILLSHEMGHYLASRRWGVDATLPFLIPAPFFFGTLGAIIKMRSPVTHRRSLFDIGAAGPIAGLVASVIVCVIGLRLSGYRLPSGYGLPFRLGQAPLFAWIARWVCGPRPVGHVLELHPVAIAAWFGFFVTFLNLMPVGQLDGGHVWYALIGRRQAYVGLAAAGLMLSLGVVGVLGAFGVLAVAAEAFVCWLVFAALVLFLVRIKHPPVMDESVRLGPVRTAVGVGLVVAFVLLFVPQPLMMV